MFEDRAPVVEIVLEKLPVSRVVRVDVAAGQNIAAVVYIEILKRREARGGSPSNGTRSNELSAVCALELVIPCVYSYIEGAA